MHEYAPEADPASGGDSLLEVQGLSMLPIMLTQRRLRRRACGQRQGEMTTVGGWMLGEGDDCGGCREFRERDEGCLESLDGGVDVRQ